MFNVARLVLRSLILILSLLLSTSLKAQTESGKVTPQDTTSIPNVIYADPLDLEIGEMIFDETMTKVGRDFYDQFYSEWSNPTSITDFSITIKERPMPGIGTQITVRIDEFEILKQFIRPNQEMIEILSEYAVGLARRYLINYQEIQAQLQSEDQSGTGIY